MKVRNFKQLDVWNKSIDVVDMIYDSTTSFPQNEKFGLASQMQKCAVSIPSNIVEGFSHQHTREYRQFCFVALGSCAGLQTQLVIARRRKYTSEREYARVEEFLNHVCRMLMNLIKKLKKQKPREKTCL